jgi:hypothetical protein
MIRHRAFLLAWFSAGLLGPHAAAAPQLLSVYPMGGQRGTVLEVEARGSGLAGAYAVWLGAGSEVMPFASPGKIQRTKSPEGLEAQIKAVPDASRAKLQVGIASSARLGFHRLGVVTPAGVSGTVAFWVGDHAVIAEHSAPHHRPDTAQPVTPPVAINGRLTGSGQRDYYAFEVPREQTVRFEVVSTSGTGFDPQLALYEVGGSFLDPGRSRRLLFQEEITQGGMPASRRMTYHFTKAGRYIVNVGNVFAQGGGDFSYLLRITTEPPADPEDALTWARRRLQEVRARAVEAPAMDVSVLREAEPNDTPAFKIPAVLEGTIGRLGDIDRFRFHATAGQQLAFEVQTPCAGPPHFNPRLDVLDAKGTVVLSNLQAQDGKVGTENAKVIQTASRVVGKLDREGTYFLRIRDLTSLSGSPDHVYRVLIRPQVPHVGTVQVRPDGPINLPPGGKQRLTLTTALQEGYAGVFALSVEGLPKGVKAFAGANNTIVELVADADAPLTPMPHVLRLSGLPLVGGKSGSAFRVAEIPIMVVKK